MADTPNTDTDPEPEGLTFEQAFQKLGELAESLEAGGLTMAETTAKYEEGMVLVRRCNLLLDQAELKITTLRDAYAQPPDEEPPF